MSLSEGDFRKWRPRLLGYAKKLTRNDTDAEDLVQEAYLHVWKYPQWYVGKDNIQVLIAMLMRRQIVGYGRYKGQGREYHQRAAFNEMVLDTDDDQVELSVMDRRSPESAAIARDLLSKMQSTREGWAAIMSGMGHSSQEIGAALGIAPGSALQSAARGRKKYRGVANA
jgi:RNA polymerase sigma factor (sigma-70 family)